MGIFPSKLKHAKIIPIYKDGNEDEPSNNYGNHIETHREHYIYWETILVDYTLPFQTVYWKLKEER